MYVRVCSCIINWCSETYVFLERSDRPVSTVLLDCLPTAIVEKKTAAFSCVNARVKGTSRRLLSIVIESLVSFCMNGDRGDSTLLEEDRNCVL